MSYLTSPLQLAERIGQSEIRGESQQESPHISSIHILDNDSLLNIFYLYRPAIFDGDEEDVERVLGGGRWDRERWWYRLAHVCKRWRNIMLGSSSYLSLCLVCTFGTPVSDMLAHSPPLLLVIDYFDEERDITAEDEEGIHLALQPGRVHRIRLRTPVPNMQKFIKAIDGEYPLLEYLILAHSTEGQSTASVLPESLQAPHLRHLVLGGFTVPMGSRLLTTAVGIVTLFLFMEYPSTYFQPNTLLQWILSMPQLETLAIVVFIPDPNSDVETQLMHTPTMTYVTLPNLRWFWFEGVSTYLEEVISRITTPRLERLDVQFLEQLTVSVPRLLQFIDSGETLRFDSVKFEFYMARVYVEMYLRGAKTHALAISLGDCWPLHRQISCVAQVFSSLSQISSAVDHLTFECRLESTRYSYSSEVYNRTEWRKLLRSFSNAKTLHVDDRLLEQVSCCLRLEDEELPQELLPELQELTYSGYADDALTSFVNARKNAGCPVTLMRFT